MEGTNQEVNYGFAPETSDELSNRNLPLVVQAVYAELKENMLNNKDIIIKQDFNDKLTDNLIALSYLFYSESNVEMLVKKSIEAIIEELKKPSIFGSKKKLSLKIAKEIINKTIYKYKKN
jgi:hypothetical protein